VGLVVAAMSYAQWLSDRRAAMHLAKSELSRRSGVNRDTIADIESGKHEPHQDTVRRLEALLGPYPGNAPAPGGVRRFKITTETTVNIEELG
jgi:transcriptional regulator with XRE-family HTH domain